MKNFLITRLEAIFPLEWDGHDKFDRICRDPNDEEAYEKTIMFLGKKWYELHVGTWNNHGSIVYLTIDALNYYIPSLLYWAHLDYRSVSLAFDAFLNRIFNTASGCIIIDNFTPIQKCFIVDFFCLFSDALSDLYGTNEHMENSLINDLIAEIPSGMSEKHR